MKGRKVFVLINEWAKIIRYERKLTYNIEIYLMNGQSCSQGPENLKISTKIAVFVYDEWACAEAVNGHWL